MLSWLRRRASRRLSAEAARDRALRARDEMDARGRPAAPVPVQLRELAGWGKPGLRSV
jgi:hypothetical protein